MDEIRTKERPKNSETKKVRFIKIAPSFTSLIPCLIPPRGLRETTERTPTQLPAHKKCCFLRLLPKKVICIPKKVDSFPEKVYSFPETVAYLFLNKKRQKSDFSCISRKKSVSLRAELQQLWLHSNILMANIKKIEPIAPITITDDEYVKLVSHISNLWEEARNRW